MKRKPDAPRVALIGCGKQKAAYTCQAQWMYRSQLFIAAKRYAMFTCDRYYILSAKHGLLRPLETIEPYDVSMASLSKDKRTAWGMRVWRQLDKAIPHEKEANATIVFLAGEKYDSALEVPLSLAPKYDGKPWADREFHWETPLEGLGIGERLHWLKEHTRFR